MDDFEKQEARLNREFLSIKVLGQPLISLSVRGVWILGACLAVCVMAWILGPKNVVNPGDRFNQGFWILIAYVALVRSIVLKFEKRIASRTESKTRFDFFGLIFGGALFFVWAMVLAFPWRSIVSSGRPTMILITIFWIILAYLHSDSLWVRSRNLDDETK